MPRYVLTERGKFIIAILLIVLLVVLPSIILAAWALGRDTPSDASLHGSSDIDPAAPEPIPEVPPDPSQPPLNGNDAESEPPDESLTDEVIFDLDAGVMTFLITSDLRSTLDDYILTMISALFTSPKYTDDSVITIEIPQLPDDDMALLTTALIDALSTFEVPINNVTFFVYQPEPDAQTYEISLSIH